MPPKHLVLIGGGHAHVIVLKRLGIKPLPGLRVTLITRDIHTPYSGMLPGHVAGFYGYRDCHINLESLARFAGAHLHHAEVEGLNPQKKVITARGCPRITYDLLSINTGSRPDSRGIPGVEDFALAAKPVDSFLARWEQLLARITSTRGEFNIVVVGSGAGGVELSLATQYRLRNTLKAAGDDPSRLHYTLLTQGGGILSSHNSGTGRRFEAVLRQRHIAIRVQSRVTEVTADCVLLADGSRIKADAVLWVTTAAAPPWPAQAGLAVDAAGFIRVNHQLQSVSHRDIFAVGDVAALPDPRPKSGVFAVRQGPVLAHNLRATATDRPLRPYRPQKHFLSLISTGNQYAVAAYGPWSFEAHWLWRVKDWIDRRFMGKFNGSQ